MAYCAKSDIEALFGISNTKKWADIENNDNDTDITNRINKAIAYADDQIDIHLKGCVHTIPFSSPPTSIVDASARLSGWWLFTSRRVEDFNENETNAVSIHRKIAMDHLADIKKGVVRLAGIAVTGIEPPEYMTES